MMKIDLSNGCVYFDKGSIDRRTHRPVFLQSGLGSEAKIVVNNEPYVTYGICPEAGIAATVSFVGDQLSGITWLQELSRDNESEWNEQLELERKQRHDGWLFDQFGPPPYHYDWGNISSEYDPKGCVSDIILNYAK